MAAPGTEEVPSLRNLTKARYGRPEKTQHRPLQDLVRPHVESFNWFLREGLSLAVQAIPKLDFSLSNGRRISLSYVDASVGVPTVAQGNTFSRTLKVYPAECRERGTTYRAGLQARIAWSVDGVNQGSVERMLGEIPLMVKSAHCNITKLTPAELIQRHEEAEEMGGYFINNGIEKVVRMLVMPRRNYPMAIVRPSWKGRGKLYTEYGVSMRCVTKDQTAATIVLHYLTNGTVTLCFVYKKEQFFVPLIIILKALVETTDQHIYSELIKGKEDNSFFKGCVASMLRQAQNEGLMTQAGILKYIGERFRVKLPVPDWYTDEEVGQFLLRQCVCIHLDSDWDKFNTLVLMTQKLFALAKGECSVENQDSPMMQEMLLAGHLYLTILKDKLELWLTQLRYGIDKRSQDKGPSYKLDTVEMMSAMRLCSDVTRGMEHFMATGSVVSKSNLGLMQTAGLTVVADKLNFMRYLSHFRCVHRGAFFAEMRTTSVRKLLPEAWGFLCPVHTPDGAPCGLLNHMTASCEAVTLQPTTVHIPKLLCSLGMAPLDSPAPAPPVDCYTVLLDGRVVGRVAANMAPDMARKLRMLKVTREGKIPVMTEIVLVPKTGKASQFPGLFLFTTPARMMRPVRNLFTGTVEMIGSFEQVYMNICVRPEEAHPGVTTHQELRETSILSVAASFTPFSDFNQSPRNMYQCQMGKQTMGTPLHAFGHRTDNKLYRIQNPQSPTVRPYAYDHYHMDDYPLGTNAVVAVISYTGYDMEDAMILNKSSLERGFGHGTIYKTEIISLRDLAQSARGPVTLVFGCAEGDKRVEGRLDDDGLPPIGSKLETGDPFYSYVDKQTGEARVVLYKNQEKAIVDNIKVLGNDQGTSDMNKVAIVMRINRNPIIGDKFSSRHGQKGVCSQQWPVEDMPFTEGGMTPDIIFNPHGFPSRMTIGMMIESMAGKSAAQHGLCHDATPFTFSEDNSAIDYYGRMLIEAGYNYYGHERMYSGVTGVEFEADIFIGVVYYQRLRHMVADKFQVRTTGPIDIVTHQPIKGRKRAGGIRFGEMERDSLLAHGATFLLQDRLFNCSDKSTCRVCTQCGSILSPLLDKPLLFCSVPQCRVFCTLCCSNSVFSPPPQLIAVPYVFRYLVAELAAMNIKVTMETK
uniref:DNA-directed RNA polymerase subunit beta n=1 Tax=Branchiostoma floridae TaxID=7739 RepID=C3YW52_BRAFL|eukprot:XP_002599494.1 hypothetical protein BRAFLDRAFT_223894 [Branchiostoma floridae]